MCGLFGNFGEPLSNNSKQLVFSALKGRGPDDQGLYLENVSADKDHWLTLFHTRLAIQDLSPLGHQPMASLSGDIRLVFNGEIYNQLHLRAELQDSVSVLIAIQRFYCMVISIGVTLFGVA